MHLALVAKLQLGHAHVFEALLRRGQAPGKPSRLHAYEAELRGQSRYQVGAW